MCLIYKQAYKLKLSKKWKTNNIFYILLLKQNITKKKQVDKNNSKLNTSSNNVKYKRKAIWNNTVYTKESKSDYLQELYYLVFWKRYLKEKNILELVLAIQHLKKIINSFYKDYLYKLIAIFKAMNIVLLMARPIIKPIAKTALKLPK